MSFSGLNFPLVSTAAEPRFLVDPHSDPVAVRIEGKASFKNCTCVKDFLDRMIEAGKRSFAMDFSGCLGMDSTFLGVLAGAALTLRRAQPRGSLVLCNLNERNAELVRNLGLNRLLTVDNGAISSSPGAAASLECKPVSDQVVGARLVFDAHQNLVAADAENAAKFRDVLDFLKQQLGDT